ncbi:hypothetical protein SAMN00808754_1897 [Thermanaeromonas toyohensis ToBE]|uniref:Uncharacterized protein n=1 Tax=Thermanaeromonas toyohensis ToBE TaxID=698762 RepID=A0A1W1VWB3_9FIRM|nr:hypothetical protein [Thermanaeromonas toyohensis]SMB97618.1 hypothetical protein SAMN00808754_1897 [Thermanaeromonas toyohensis ToBE]
MFRARAAMMTPKPQRGWLRWLAWLAYPMGLLHGALLARFFFQPKEQASPQG